MTPVEISVSCKIITPMLASGANQQEFEIRATEIKSALRFWWRAFHPYNGKELFEKESEIFGNTHKKAAFQLFVTQDKIETYDIGEAHGWGEGVQYCLYPINQLAKQKNGRIVEPARIKSEKKGGRSLAKPTKDVAFTIYFIFYKDKNNTIEDFIRVIEDIICALWLLVNLGGIGGRTRRGAGCVEIVKIKPEMDEKMDLDWQLLDNLFNYKKYDSSINFIAAGLEIMRNRWFDPNKTYEIPDYTAFRPGQSQIYVCSDPRTGKGTCAMKAMDSVGLGMKSFRYINPYHEAKEMHEAVNGGKMPAFNILEKAQMGLPIIYNFRDRERFDKGGPPKRGNQYETKDVRRASPLLISCHCFKGIPYAVLCIFPAPILPKGKKIQLKAKDSRKNFHVDPPSPDQFDYMANLVYEGDERHDPIGSNFNQIIQVC